MGQDALDASRKFSASWDRLSGQLIGLRNNLATEIMPLMTRFIDLISENVVPALGGFIDRLGDVIGWFEGLPDPVLEAMGVIASAFAVGGPALVAIGVFSSALGALVAATGPLGLLIAGASLAAAAWVVWGDDIKAAVGGAIDFVSGKFQALLDWMQSIIDKALEVSQAITNALTPGRVGGPRGADLGTDVGTAGGGGVVGIPGFGMGQEMINGMVGGMGQAITDNEDLIRQYIDRVPSIAKDQLQIQSPSRVFHEIGGYMGEGMANGIRDSQALVAAATESLGKSAVNTTGKAVASILGSMGTLFNESKKFAIAQSLVNSYLAFTEVLKDPSLIGRPFARVAAAGAVLASGLAQVKAIRSASPGGGGGGAVASSGGGASSAAAAPAQAPQQNVQTLNFSVTNDPFGISDRLIRQIVGSINQAQRDGSTLINARVT
jgi:hypothetical protein